MYCPQCGYENPDDAKFCIGCRYNYPSRPAPSPPPAEEPVLIEADFESEKWWCANCGKLVDDNFELCWNCQSARPTDSEVVAAPRDDREQELREDREQAEAQLRKRERPIANPFRGCVLSVLGVLVCMILMMIVVSMGYVLPGYLILYGAGPVFLGFASKNFWAMPRYQKVLSLAGAVGFFSLLMISYTLFDPLFAFIPFLGFGLTAVLWWWGVRMRRQLEERDG